MLTDKPLLLKEFNPRSKQLKVLLVNEKRVAIYFLSIHKRVKNAVHRSRGSDLSWITPANGHLT